MPERLISPTVTECPRPAIASRCSAAYRRAPAAVTRSCTTAKTASAATAVAMRITRGRTAIDSDYTVGPDFAPFGASSRQACGGCLASRNGEEPTTHEYSRSHDTQPAVRIAWRQHSERRAHHARLRYGR